MLDQGTFTAERYTAMDILIDKSLATGTPGLDPNREPP